VPSDPDLHPDQQRDPDQPRGQPSGAEPPGQPEQPQPTGQQTQDRRCDYCRKAREVLYWIWQHRPSANQWLALGTWALAIFAYLALRDGRVALEQNQRAWVGPVNTGFETTLTVDAPIPVMVNYHNTGREPARDVFYDLDYFVITEAEDRAGGTNRRVADYVGKCFGTAPPKGYTVVFPTTGFSSYTGMKEIPGASIDWDVMYGVKFIVLTGCYVYITNNETRRTTFCNFFQNGRTSARSWAFCPTGNYAN
jgi:hypothetical protein